MRGLFVCSGGRTQIRVVFVHAGFMQMFATRLQAAFALCENWSILCSISDLRDRVAWLDETSRYVHHPRFANLL